MASFLGVPYADVVAAAFLPALLFYIALLFQVDMYAARNGLKGLPSSDLRPLGKVLLDGWPYLLCLSVLIFVLMVMRLETYSPYAASVVLLVTTALRGETRLDLERAKALLVDTASNIASLVAILAGIGLVVGGLSYTGVAGAFSRELLLYAGNNVPLMLIAGAVTSFVLGMGMTVSACYIFLSILLAPALIEAGLNPLASHLFILYWGMLSYITPPVALASITAANLAGANPMKTGLYSMRLGGALFVLPFIFIHDNGLIFEGSIFGIIRSFLIAAAALWALTSAFEGYLYGIGPANFLSRVLMGIAGMMAIIPEFYSDLIGLALILCVYATHLFLLRNNRGTTS